MMNNKFHAARITQHTSRSIYLLIFAIALYIAVFGWLATTRHLAYESGALDLGNYDQAMWNAAHGRGLALTTVPQLSLNRMGLHVEPILFLLIPLYWLFSTPLTLIWVQTVALGLAALPLFLISRRWLGSEWAALAIAAAYLLLPATESVNMFDFHAVALSPFFMLWALYFLDSAVGLSSVGYHVSRITPNRRHVIPAILFLLLAMSTKEDISLHVLMLGAYIMLIRRKWKLGGGVAMLGLVWAVVAFGVVIPAFRTGGGQSAYVGFFPTLGNSPLEIALSPVTRPAEVWRLFTRPQSLRALAMLTVPVAFLNVAGLPVFAIAAPSLAITLLSNNPLQQQLESWHYAAPMLPFVLLATADGLKRMQNIKFKGQKSFYLLPFALLIAMSLGYHFLRGYSPAAKPFHLPQVTAHQRAGDALAAKIPPDAAVVAQAELEPHISQRRQISIWQGDFPADADFFWLDVAHPKFVNRDNAQAQTLGALVLDESLGIAAANDGYLLLRRGAGRELPPEFYNFLYAEGARWQSAPEMARFGDELSLVGVETHTNREAEPQVTLYFRVLRQPAEDYFLRLYLLSDNDVPQGATIFPQPALVWLPTSKWETGRVLRVRFNTLPWWTGDGMHRRFGYAVAVARDGGNPQADPWDESLRLPAVGARVLPGNLVPVQKFYRLAGMVYAK